MEKERLKDIGKTALDIGSDFIPGVSEAKDVAGIASGIKEGDYATAGIHAAGLALGAIPVVGDVARRGLLTLAKRPISKTDKDTFEVLGITEKERSAWREKHGTTPEFKKNLTGRDPLLTGLAKGLKEGEVTLSEYRELADYKRPIRKRTQVTPPATHEETAKALNDDRARKGILGLNRDIPEGEEITARLDISAYEKYNTWVASLTHNKKTLYSPTVVMRDVTFILPSPIDKGASKKALAVAAGGTKNPFAAYTGKFVNATDDSAFEAAKDLFDDPEWIQVGYDPTRRGFFYDRETGAPVISAVETIQVGALVLAKKAKLGDIKDYGFNKGGVVPMQEQMRMAFMENGGLQDDGATLDPVSGNEVPAGSMDQEVRDDIPARLSEGEYVVPADVVRYFGVKFFEDLRTEAKRGMGQMDADGRIGGEPLPEEDNEELPIPLEEVQMMAQGGVVKAANGTDVNPTFSYTPNTRYGSSSQSFGVQFREFTNPSLNRTITIPFFNGQPMSVIPEGFMPSEQAASQAQTGDTTTAPADGGGGTGPSPYIGTGGGNVVHPSEYTTGDDFLAGMESNTGILATIAGFSPILGAIGKMNHTAGVKRANELVTEHTQSVAAGNKKGTLNDFDLIAMGAYALTPPKSGPGFFSGIASLLTGKGSNELKNVEIYDMQKTQDGEFYRHPLYGPLLKKVGDKEFTYNKGMTVEGDFQKASTGTLDELLGFAKATLPAVQQNKSQVEGMYDNTALVGEGSKKGVAQRSFESTGHVLTNYGSMSFVPDANNVRSLDIFRVEDGSGRPKMFRRYELEELIGKKNLTSKDLLEFDPTKYKSEPTGEKGWLGEDKLKWVETGTPESEATESKTGGKTPPPMDELVTPFESTTQPSQAAVATSPAPDYATMDMGEAGRGGVPTATSSTPFDPRTAGLTPQSGLGLGQPTTREEEAQRRYPNYGSPTTSSTQTDEQMADILNVPTSTNMYAGQDNMKNIVAERQANMAAEMANNERMRRANDMRDRESQRGAESGLLPQDQVQRSSPWTDRDMLNDARLRRDYAPVQDPAVVGGPDYESGTATKYYSKADPVTTILQPVETAPSEEDVLRQTSPGYVGTGLETTPDVSTEEFEPIIPDDKPTLTEPPVSSGEGQPPVEVGGVGEEFAPIVPDEDTQMDSIEAENNPIFKEILFHEASVQDFDDVLKSPTIANAGGIQSGLDGNPAFFKPYQVTLANGEKEKNWTLGPGINLGENLTEAELTKLYTPEEVKGMVVKRFNESKNAVDKEFGNNLPPHVQKAIVGMHFNMGAGRFSGFSEMRKELKNGDYTKAALEIITTKEKDGGRKPTDYVGDVETRANYYAGLLLGMNPDIENPPSTEAVLGTIKRKEEGKSGTVVDAGTIDDEAKRKAALEAAKKKNAEAIAKRNAEKAAQRKKAEEEKKAKELEEKLRREKQRERNRKAQAKARADAEKKQKDKTVYTGGGAGSGSGIALKSGGLVKRRSNKKGKK